MAITSARMQHKRGEEVNFDPDKMLPGEWAVSLDTKYVRMCFSPGVCVRMATYDAFEADMVKIQKILEECQTIEDAVKQIQSEIDAKEIVIEKYVQDAKTYSETASDEADRATLEADRAKAEADRAQGIVGGDYVTHAEIVEYSLIKNTGYELSLSIDESTYVMTIGLKNANGSVLSEKTIDFPIESMVVNATYKDGIITLLLQNGETVPVEVSALISGLVNDTLTIAGIDLKDNITVDELKEALGIYPLDSYEEIMANTEQNRNAGALGVKEGFTQLTNSLTKTNLCIPLEKTIMPALLRESDVPEFGYVIIIPFSPIMRAKSYTIDRMLINNIMYISDGWTDVNINKFFNNILDQKAKLKRIKIEELGEVILFLFYCQHVLTIFYRI